MRILGFLKHWAKLEQKEFSTFRFPRSDIDWQAGELVQVVYKPRTKERKVLGIARIMRKERREFDPHFADKDCPLVTEEEAKADGFASVDDMVKWMERQYGFDFIPRMNKLTLQWKEAIGEIR